MNTFYNCVKYKFDAQQIYFEYYAEFNSVDEYLKSQNTLEENTYCLIYDNLSSLDNSSLNIADSFLIESLSSGNQKFSIVCLKRTGSEINLNFNKNIPKIANKNISISLICSEDKIYTEFLIKAVGYYTAQLSGVIDFDINVAYYGDNPPEEILGKANIIKMPRKDFHMSHARNQSLSLCKKNNILMTDLDIYISKDLILNLLSKLEEIPNDGVLNLKNDYKMGNGIYLGTKEHILKNNYNEKFKLYWYEDTEYLMNFSRIGILPIVLFVDFFREDHSRSITGDHYMFNHELFKTILYKGRNYEI